MLNKIYKYFVRVQMYVVAEFYVQLENWIDISLQFRTFMLWL